MVPTPAPILYYKTGNQSVPLDISQIEVLDPKNFTANVTSVLEVLLDDQRAKILLENAWNITSVRRATDEHDPNLTYVDVEFQKEGLSFFIGVDEREGLTLQGYSGAPWGGERSPYPKPYYQSESLRGSNTMIVYDNRNEQSVIIMIYNKTAIFYLSPSSIPPEEVIQSLIRTNQW
jgi:hypothetical protein